MPSRARQVLAQFVAARAALPPVQAAIEGFSGNGLHLGVQQAGPSQVEHHFGKSAGQEDLNGGEVAGAVGQCVYQARDLAVDVGPIGGHGALEACRVGDGGQVQQQVGGSAEGSVGHHGIFERMPG